MTDPKEEEATAAKWTSIALVHGFNQLAKDAKTLGEKVFFRLARDQAEKECEKRGVRFTKTEQEGNQTVLVLHEAKPYISFESRDIELMRAVVAEHDAKKIAP